MIASYALIQISAILDMQGEYSLGVQNVSTDPTVNKRRLGKLFPALTNKELETLCRKANDLLSRHKSSVQQIMRIRNRKLAHMGSVSAQTRKWSEHSFYSLKNIVPKRFAYIKLLKLCTAIADDLLDPVYFQVEDKFQKQGHVHRGS